MKGICQLCLETRELQDSHLSPKALYKYVMRARTPHDAAPVMIDYEEGNAVQRNQQARQHLLCADCEERLSKCGENYVHKNCCVEEGKFPLRETLERINPSKVSNGRRMWLINQLNEQIDVTALKHYACGYLWKYSIADACTGGWGAYKGKLGDHYAEQFRLFLLGEAEFPKNAHLNVYIDFDEPSWTPVSAPTCKKETIGKFKMKVHQFFIPGINFVVHLGGDTRRFVDTDNADLGDTTVVEWSATQSGFFDSLSAQTKNVTMRGKLASST